MDDTAEELSAVLSEGAEASEDCVSAELVSEEAAPELTEGEELLSAGPQPANTEDTIAVMIITARNFMYFDFFIMDPSLSDSLLIRRFLPLQIEVQAGRTASEDHDNRNDNPCDRAAGQAATFIRPAAGSDCAGAGRRGGGLRY